MDAQVIGIAGTPTTMPQMDLYVPPATTGQHIVPMITGQTEEEQQAQVACSEVLGSIPQLPSSGVDWPTFLVGSGSFPALDASIRQNLSDSGRSDYQPTYDIINDALSVVASKQTPLT